MTLEDLGYNTDLENYRKEQNLDSFDVGRVVAEHKERYIVRTATNEFEAEVIGNLRFTALDRSDFPAVGDWVAISGYDENKVLIHAIFPRKTILERTAAGTSGEKQIIATNIDHAFIVQSADRDFNLNRMERYLTISYDSGVEPILVLSKTDLISESQLNKILKMVKDRIKQVPLIPISNKTRTGYEKLLKHMRRGETYCVLGSSGAGKSTLINNISGHSRMKTGPISRSRGKGKHVTSHRELIVLDKQGILIDNPGMREVGIANAAHGLETAFDQIYSLSEKCKFKNCTHSHESGCAVIEAVEQGLLDRASYDNYLRMQKERMHFESSSAERRRKDREFGKMIKNYKKDKRRNE